MGHSEGTTQIMVAGSMMPEYFNEKIKIAILLAPAVFFGNHSSEMLIFFS